ncbi:hypothetical protein CI102_15309 [Trichoderma harzianum]|nr:hypothetical protein CI102_15309 [Trichoderma harzianum]
MSTAQEVEYCPVRTNIDLSNVQFSDFSNVQYFEKNDSEVGSKVSVDNKGNWRHSPRAHFFQYLPMLILRQKMMPLKIRPRLKSSLKRPR